MKIMTVDNQIKINKVNLIDYLHTKNTNTLENVIFCNVSGMLSIRRDEDKILRLIFTPICYPKLIPIKYVNSMDLFSEMIQTLTTTLDANYRKQESCYYNDFYVIKTYQTNDNYFLTIEEK